MIKIAVDLTGADRPQEELVSGAVRAASENPELFLYLCGSRSALEGAIDASAPMERIELVDCTQVITNNDDPTEAFKTKKDSALVRGMSLCKSDPEIGGFVSCGPTGAIFVSALMLLGRVVPVSPMLLVELERTDGTPVCIVDCGANVDCCAEKLVDFARMGTAYMKAVGVSEPRVGLLSNGAEDKKGSAVVKQANELLHKSGLRFIGNTEANRVLEGEADVIACEGFAGNILLKSIEGSAKAALSELRRLTEGRLSPESEAGKAVAELYAKYDFNTRGGAFLLGTKLPIVKGHGAATSETVYNIVCAAYRLAANGLTEKIKAEFGKQPRQ